MPSPIITGPHGGGEDEVRQWYESGWTYDQMVEEYRTKYNLEVSPTAFSNLRARRGWARRINRDDTLIPWEVREEHRWNRMVMMLRVLARQRAGFALRERDRTELESWLARLEESGGVIHYDPDTEQGFFVVPREEGDTDIIRQPDKGNRTKRHTRG